MSKRRDIENHRQRLEEIANIMNAMKNLAYMEARKIGGFLDAQHSVVHHIEAMAQDFLDFYPNTLAQSRNQQAGVSLLIGSERGFCGDFNHVLLRQYEHSLIATTGENQLLITVGYKLALLVQKDQDKSIVIEGASVVEEVNNVLNQLVNQLVKIQQQNGALNLMVLYHNDQQQLIYRQLLPPFQEFIHHQPSQAFAVEINLEPEKFILDLTYHYLFAVLYEILYSSLMAENKQRLAHLDAAVQHIQKRSEELNKKSRILRQEEIIEEIEVILLSAVSLND